MREYFDSLNIRASSSTERRGGGGRPPGGGDAGGLRLPNPPPHLGEGGAGVEGDDVDARRHELVRQPVAELDDGLHHLPLRALEDALLFADVDERLHFLLGDFLFFLVVVEVALALEAREEAPQREED